MENSHILLNYRFTLYLIAVWREGCCGFSIIFNQSSFFNCIVIKGEGFIFQFKKYSILHTYNIPYYKNPGYKENTRSSERQRKFQRKVGDTKQNIFPPNMPFIASPFLAGILDSCNTDLHYFLKWNTWCFTYIRSSRNKTVWYLDIMVYFQ